MLGALVAAYLSDCIPGLGSGGSLGVPAASDPASATPASAPESEPAAVEIDEAGGRRITLVVEGDRCTRGTLPAAPCPEVCAGLDQARASSIAIEIDASSGRHGTVEQLRTCLKDAGFVDIVVRSE